MPYTQRKGFDASHYDDPVDFGAAVEAGYEFVFLKASEGLGDDPTFLARQPVVREKFPVRGYYHFIRSAGIDATQQGQHVRNVVGQLTANEYVVFDVEDGCGLSGSDGIAYLETLISAAGYATEQVMIYTSLGWFNDTFGAAGAQLSDYHLWAARYGPELGDTSPWSAALVWQSDEHADIPGIASGGSGDLDWWLDGHWPV
jgi:GH25 family lysozyme M1 (1,4-beta-N-acetylmuramidase)